MKEYFLLQEKKKTRGENVACGVTNMYYPPAGDISALGRLTEQRASQANEGDASHCNN